MRSEHRTLVIGFGNPGRLDDGLGPALVAKLEAAPIPGVTVDSDYQLMVEDATAIAEHDIVIFVDASLNAAPPFSFEEVLPKPDLSFTTHSVSPPALLGLAHELFNAKTRGYIIGIRGYDFDAFGERLSQQAQENLESAFLFLDEVLRQQNFSALEARAS